MKVMHKYNSIRGRYRGRNSNIYNKYRIMLDDDTYALLVAAADIREMTVRQFVKHAICEFIAERQQS